MADTKISALTGATTPLAGTEVLPIVQSGTTVKVSVANLTAGRAISATSATLSSLTSGRVPYATTSGLLTDSANLRFDGTNLGINATPTSNIPLKIGGAGGSPANSDINFCGYNPFGNAFMALASTNTASGFYIGSSSNAPVYGIQNDAVATTTDTSKNFTVNSGNLIVGTAGKSVTLPGGIIWKSGSGSPEGVVTAPVGSLYSRSDGGLLTSLYVKESGSGNTGWVGK